MDENSYRVGYLGASTLSQISTGLGSLQKPLRELYIPHRKPGNPTVLPERFLSVTPEGLTIAYFDDEAARSRLITQDFYPLNSILLWDAVRFIAVRGTEKKDKKQVRCAFEPLDNDHSRVKENLFSTIDKKLHYVTEQHHPPMFTCVVRRKAGVKALDVHVFVCVNDSEAVGVVQALNQVQNDLSANQSHQTGVFGYQPFGKGTVRAPSGSPIVKIASPPSGYNDRQKKSSATDVHSRHAHTQRQLQPISVNSKTVQQTNDISVYANFTPQQHNYNTNRSNDSTSSANSSRFGSQSRIFNLSQDDLLGSGLSVAPSVEDSSHSLDDQEDEYDDGYQYLPHITHSLERRSRGNQPANRDFESDLLAQQTTGGPNDLARSHNYPGIGHNSPHSRSLENEAKQQKYSRNTTGNILGQGGEYSENQPFSYALGQQKSSSVSPKKINSNKGLSFRQDQPPPLPSPNHNMGQGYSLLSGPNEHPRRHGSDSLQDYYPHHQSGSNSSPRTSRRDVVSSVSDNPQVSEETNRKIFKELLQYQKHQQHSSLQKQDGEGGSSDRMGNRAPQLRPPKSPGYLDRPPGVSVNNSQDESPEDNTAVPANTSDPFPLQDRSSSNEAIKNKPVARVPPHMVTGVRVLPSNPSTPRRNPADNDLTSPSKPDRPKSGMFLQSLTSPELRKNKTFGNNPRRAQSQYDIANEMGLLSNSSYSGSKTKQEQKPSKGNWQLGANSGGGKTSSSSRENSLKSRSQREVENNMDDNKFGEKLLLSKKKDAEIASVMQNLRLDYKDTPTLTPGAPCGMNLENSLGYFP